MKRFFRVCLKHSSRAFCLLLCLCLLFTSCLSGCDLKTSIKRDLSAYKRIGTEAIVKGDTPLLPDRPYFLSEEKDVKEVSLRQLLAEQSFTLPLLLSGKQALEKLMQAKDLSEVVKTKAELRGLKALRAEAQKQLRTASTVSPGFSLDALPDLSELIQKIDNLILKDATAHATTQDLVVGSSQNDLLKATWTTPDKVVLRWEPGKFWIPLSGYDLY